MFSIINVGKITKKLRELENKQKIDFFFKKKGKKGNKQKYINASLKKIGKQNIKVKRLFLRMSEDKPNY